MLHTISYPPCYKEKISDVFHATIREIYNDDCCTKRAGELFPKLIRVIMTEPSGRKGAPLLRTGFFPDLILFY